VTTSSKRKNTLGRECLPYYDIEEAKKREELLLASFTVRAVLDAARHLKGLPREGARDAKSATRVMRENELPGVKKRRRPSCQHALYQQINKRAKAQPKNGVPAGVGGISLGQQALWKRRIKDGNSIESQKASRFPNCTLWLSRLSIYPLSASSRKDRSEE